MPSSTVNRLWFILGGFLFGLAVGYLIWGAGFWLKLFSPPEKIDVADSGFDTAKVKSVTDGDTLELTTGEAVRLLGIDAPEYSEPCFEQARQGLSNLVTDGEVKLGAGQEDKDKYGRLLRWILVDDLNVNIELVEKGLVKAYLYGELVYADMLADAEAQARDELTGCLWSSQVDFSDWPVVDYSQALGYIGEQVRVTGVIDNVFISGAGNIFINFCVSYKTCAFSAVIFKSDQHRFDTLPDTSWAGEEVIISGQIEEYEGRAEIIFSEPGQMAWGE